MKIAKSPGRPRLNPAAALTVAERQARLRARGRDAITRLDAARKVIHRVDRAVRLCGDVEIVGAWHELQDILMANPGDAADK
jgi:hypothetical protein